MNNESMQSQSIKEQLSALMDGELSRDETRFLMRRLDADAQLAKTWSSYQIASDVLKKRYAAPMRPDFAASVMQAIAVEPTPARGGWLRWAGGGAIAAAVAVVALTTIRPPDETLSQQQPAIAAINGTSVTTGRSTLPAEQQMKNGILPVFPTLNYSTEAASFDRFLDQRPAQPYPYPMLMDVHAPQIIYAVPAESKR
jgi:sigma-E factor negative regulatory protein RseA